MLLLKQVDCFFKDACNSFCWQKVYLNWTHTVHKWPQKVKHTWSHYWIFLSRETIACYSASQQGRTFIRGKSIDENLRASIIDDFVAEGGDPASGILEGSIKKLPTGKHKRTWLRHEGTFSHAFAFLVNSQKPHDPKHSHLCRKWQLLRLALKKRSTCFGSIIRVQTYTIVFSADEASLSIS